MHKGMDMALHGPRLHCKYCGNESVLPMCYLCQYNNKTTRSHCHGCGYGYECCVGKCEICIVPEKEIISPQIKLIIGGEQILNLRGSNINNLPANISKLTNLTKLNLSETKINDDGLTHLKHLTNLTNLNLIGTKISDVGLVHIKHLTKLIRLGLRKTKISDAGIAELKEALPNCKICSDFD